HRSEAVVGLDHARRLDHRAQQVAYLAAPAAGQQREQAPVCGQSVALERGSAILGGRDAVEQRMADEGDARAGAGIKLGLERQYHGEPVGALDDAGHTAASPGPDLWRDVVEHWDAGTFGGARERHVEL